MLCILNEYEKHKTPYTSKNSCTSDIHLTLLRVYLEKGITFLMLKNASTQHYSTIWVSWPWNMSIISCGPPNKVVISICYSHIQVRTWKFGWSYTHGLLTKIIVYLNTIHKEYYCLSGHYSWHHYYLTIPTHFTIFIIFMSALFISMLVSSYHLSFFP